MLSVVQRPLTALRQCTDYVFYSTLLIYFDIYNILCIILILRSHYDITYYRVNCNNRLMYITSLNETHTFTFKMLGAPYAGHNKNKTRSNNMHA